ncbi:Crp/Fnr family transcriptional regulator [uncultured Piscinibacter sp.]|uniref:Crp/Fnr family transcriptional regulator n=1 Tax=uncultured Piscinibacter sp. TaxID=1131835 RepID=UPI00262F5D2F|nr:Crp/Fnr family transcriptional regulator [uncultured Piscinibacter sp.]
MHSPSENNLIAALTDAELAPIVASLERVSMRLGDTLYEAGSPMRHAYFPTTSVVSLHHVMACGASAEAAGVGREGMVGIALFTGGVSATGSAVVRSSGWGYRMDGVSLARAFEAECSMRRVLLRYMQALVTQIAQTAVCYRHHTIEQQLSRWLLSTLERLPTGELVMTQELIANLLGVRRESITQAACALQDGGYIRYRRGHITVLDAGGLRTRACECHAVVTAELRRLLGPDDGATTTACGAARG